MISELETQIMNRLPIQWLYTATGAPHGNKDGESALHRPDQCAGPYIGHV